MGLSLPPYRLVLPWVFGTAFLVVTAIAVWRLVGLREASIVRERERIEEQLRDHVASWEEGLLDDLMEVLDNAAADPDRAGVGQARMRRSKPWFDSLYIWHPRQTREQDGAILVVREAEWVFPTPARVPPRDQILGHFCLARARLLASNPNVDTAVVIRAYQLGCRSEELPVRLVAATEAATLLDGLDQPAAALKVLDDVGLPHKLSLRGAGNQGIAPFLVTSHRFQRAQLTMRMGREEEGLNLYYRTGLDITSLDSPDVAGLLPFVQWPIERNLRQHGRDADADRLLAMAQRAQRRVVARRELSERILRRLPEPDTEPRLIYDQYSDENNPFLLYYGWIDDHGVAIQLEQNILVQDFLAKLRGLRRAVTITDSKGNWVAGAKKGGDVAISVSFPGTLSHLRVGIRQSVLDNATANMEDQWMGPLVVVGVVALLGFIAFTAQIRATRQELILMARQREFTTRVTHELKTPLAGIRVMAENLELGAYRTDAQRIQMAQRIVEEADRLKARVDEVLTLVQERTIPDPKPFDPEEAVLEAIDMWGPRLGDAGVVLHADLHPAEMVVGDMPAFRDAVGCLLDNALKYRREDIESSGVWLVLKQVGRKVAVEVADNGMGVPPKLRKAVFDRFVRVEGPNRGRSGGHGLGLAQVYQVVRAHKGTVRCTEGVDGGARFVIEVPSTASD